MSTPTTAVATHPPYHTYYQHQPYPPHHNNYAHQPSTSTAPGGPYHRQGTSSNPARPSVVSPSSSSSSLLPPYHQFAGINRGQSSATAAAAGPDGLAQLHHQPSAPIPPPHDPKYLSARQEMASQQSHSLRYEPEAERADSYASGRLNGQHSEQPSRKRRRSGEPDWNTFYRNGLPREIIVIDDTPEPEANTGRRISRISTINGTAAVAAAANLQNGSLQEPSSKRRRRDIDPITTQPSAYHNPYLGSQHSTPFQNVTPYGSTVNSSERANSGLCTTAATSLSSNGQPDDVTLASQKRKRTRQQAATEAKRRDVDGLGDAFFTYKPPPLPPKKASEVPVRVVQDHRYNAHVKVDDEDGHYIVVPDAELTEKYQISRLLGQGTFGKVVQARDRKRNRLVAIKIIRSVQKYRDASRIELRVLATLKANDYDNRNRCIHLRDCFDYRGHICIVMDLLDQSVFDFLKGNSFVPFPNSHIQSFARQLFTSVAFLHDLNLIHTDLKPENILLCNRNYQTFTYNQRIPSSSSTVHRQATQRRVLLDTEIRLIDFGSATFQNEYHSSVVSTRHYRAPEIILGLGWSFPCDIWSIGCILVEFYTGDALYQTHDNLEHLAMMEAVVGRRIDSHLVQAVNKMSTRSGGNSASKYFKRLRLDYPTPDTTRGSRRFVKAMKNLNDVIPSTTPFLRNFLDLLRKVFVYDPALRITAKEALEHPWFHEMAPPDDGTEAAKLRLERRRVEQHAAQQLNGV